MHNIIPHKYIKNVFEKLDICMCIVVQVAGAHSQSPRVYSTYLNENVAEFSMCCCAHMIHLSHIQCLLYGLEFMYVYVYGSVCASVVVERMKYTKPLAVKYCLI